MVIDMGYYKNYLFHHGVKGQKWGVRRYQDSEGHYTELGRKRNIAATRIRRTEKTRKQVDELKAIMPSVFTSNELLGIGWSDYTPEDLEAILGRSEVFIDELKYKGRFKESYQQHAFPRVLGTGYVVEKEDERLKKALLQAAAQLLSMQFLGLKNSAKHLQATREQALKFSFVPWRSR